MVEKEDNCAIAQKPIPEGQLRPLSGLDTPEQQSEATM